MEQDFKLEVLTHAILAQYHRWYQVYEVPFTKKTIANQKDILGDDIEIITHAATTKGKDGLEERLKVYEGWLNAHHVQHTEVKQLSENELSLEADIIYQNIRPDETKYSYTIHYSTLLSLRKNDLPVFTKIQLTPTGEIKDFIFQSAYAENRCKSLIYYWFYLIEILPHNFENFTELVAAEFSIQLVDGVVIKSTKELSAYFETVSSKIKTGIHRIFDIDIKQVEEDVFSVAMNVNWKGISTDGQQLTRDTKHEWLLVNNKEEQFARIKNMIITLI